MYHCWQIVDFRLNIPNHPFGIARHPDYNARLD